jgi:anti-sigma regulatory factor (Ser/Thr protein kinase)/NAD-dependent dihydropyrimidine dehydrogenase PreA subunit
MREGDTGMITVSYRISGGDFDSAGIATRMLKEQLARIGVGAQSMRRAMIASYEAEMNVVIHARTGTLWARVDEKKLDLEVADEGPGIPDVDLALKEGWSTASSQARQMGFGAGMGLPNIRRNSDFFDIETRVGKGTRIRSTILLARADTVEKPDPSELWSQVLSVDHARCRSCMRCVFACPTAAIRVHADGPMVRNELCIGCTACTAACERSVFGLVDTGDARGDLPPLPADGVLVVPRGFLSGFPVSDSPLRVMGALRQIGFAEVRLLDEWEQALRAAARVRADSSRGPRPLIPPFCPAVVALVESRFPSLIPHLGPWLSPVEAAGEEFPLRPVMIVAACPAQMFVSGVASLTGRLTVVGPVRLSELVRPLLAAGGNLAEPPEAADGKTVREVPAAIPGELSVSGIRHVLTVLAEVEAGALGDVSLLDLTLCETGCSGSPLLCADPYLSLHRWEGGGRVPAAERSDAVAVPRRRPWTQRPGVRLDPDMGEAIRKLAAIDSMTRGLPGRDCGACGAPTCADFAEDVVLGRAAERCPYAAGSGAREMEETR